MTEELEGSEEELRDGLIDSFDMKKNTNFKKCGEWKKKVTFALNCLLRNK